MINRQRVEKLSEELEQQRSRRHGYVQRRSNFRPSASPALQKNFDRFDGLLNDFGRFFSLLYSE
uniref:DAD domain-containing protein n=1 Tax=Ascaris lumbricoides TaxID=6252 RepID=A0A0M3ITD6_ASCLU